MPDSAQSPTKENDRTRFTDWIQPRGEDNPALKKLIADIDRQSGVIYARAQATLSRDFMNDQLKSLMVKAKGQINGKDKATFARITARKPSLVVHQELVDKGTPFTRDQQLFRKVHVIETVLPIYCRHMEKTADQKIREVMFATEEHKEENDGLPPLMGKDGKQIVMALSALPGGRSYFINRSNEQQKQRTQ